MTFSAIQLYTYMVKKGTQHYPSRKAVQLFWKRIRKAILVRIAEKEKERVNFPILSFMQADL